MSLDRFLEEKPLYYTEIDYTRMPRVYEKIKSHFRSGEIIHIVGTNGKGTTGRFLASALFAMGYKTAHYTSPHIADFNERIWIEGENVSDKALENAHLELQSILSQEDSDALSYFEYTTFLAMLMFNGCDYIVLEAGLGGVHDATAVFAKRATLVTPIDYDHQSFLGTEIEDIANEKLQAVQNNAIIAKQKHEAVYNVADAIMAANNVKIVKLDAYISADDKVKIAQISKKLSLAHYLEQNLSLSIACLNFLGLSYSVKHFENSKLFGRLTQYKKNIIIDVGHNPLAAESIVEALEGGNYTLIYNTYKDKEYKKTLQILKPIVSDVEIIDINLQRIEVTEQLQNTLTDLEIKYQTFQEIDESKNYLVFGSFSVVEAFLKVDSE